MTCDVKWNQTCKIYMCFCIVIVLHIFVFTFSCRISEWLLTYEVYSWKLRKEYNVFFLQTLKLGDQDFLGMASCTLSEVSLIVFICNLMTNVLFGLNIYPLRNFHVLINNKLSSRLRYVVMLGNGFW